MLLMVYFDLAILLFWQVTSIQQVSEGKKYRDRYGYMRPQFSLDVVLIMIVFKAGVCFMPLWSWIEKIVKSGTLRVAYVTTRLATSHLTEIGVS